MICQTQQQALFTFISSYRGKHSYEAKLIEGGVVCRTIRLECRVTDDPFEDPCTLSREDWESQINGKVGLVTTYPTEVLTDAFVASFNQWLFAEWEREVRTITEHPEVYGVDVPSHCPVFVGGRYDAVNGWAPLQDYDALVKLAGLPVERCSDPRLKFVVSGETSAPVAAR